MNKHARLEKPRAYDADYYGWTLDQAAAVGAVPLIELVPDGRLDTRWASAWGTSTAAPESPSWRATA